MTSERTASDAEGWDSFVKRALSAPRMSDSVTLAERLRVEIIESVLGDRAPKVGAVPVRLVRTESIAVESRVEAATLAAIPGTRKASQIITWLETFSVFIPKSIREPALGDLYEDIERMRARGSSPAAMWWAVVAQLGLLALQRLIPRWLRR